jgi:hypothetical protein
MWLCCGFSIGLGLRRSVSCKETTAARYNQ